MTAECPHAQTADEATAGRAQVPEVERCFYEVWPATGPWRPTFDIDVVCSEEEKAERLHDTTAGIVAFLEKHCKVPGLTSENFKLVDCSTSTRLLCAPRLPLCAA